MFVFGEKVVVTDETLKTYNKVGLYVGKNFRGQAKVYLEEPLKTSKTSVSCITIAEDKIKRYAKTEIERLEQRLDELNSKRTALAKELKTIEDEIYEIEYKLMRGV